MQYTICRIHYTAGLHDSEARYYSNEVIWLHFNSGKKYYSNEKVWLHFGDHKIIFRSWLITYIHWKVLRIENFLHNRGESGWDYVMLSKDEVLVAKILTE